MADYGWISSRWEEVSGSEINSKRGKERRLRVVRNEVTVAGEGREGSQRQSYERGEDGEVKEEEEEKDVEEEQGKKNISQKQEEEEVVVDEMKQEQEGKRIRSRRRKITRAGNKISKWAVYAREEELANKNQVSHTSLSARPPSPHSLTPAAPSFAAASLSLPTCPASLARSPASPGLPRVPPGVGRRRCRHTPIKAPSGDGEGNQLINIPHDPGTSQLSVSSETWWREDVCRAAPLDSASLPPSAAPSELVFLGWMDDGLSGLGGNPWMYQSVNWKVRHVNRKINALFFCS
ncbi:hypothetical protein E2C01_047779 [Portunus trituberculatus]|uniref:Uncharacterized protein n=1 Tax=Portunus trituberculatus TaxID=210409 RepID=A0A5B7G8T1_PORTR|nr:hypothetical protein [Portunus trituberculatus]